MIERYFAEMNTDKIIREKYFHSKNPGIMVEVGGATPEYISMSRHFKLNGWRCIIIEPNPRFAKMHKDIGNEVYEIACSYEDKDNCDFEVVANHPHPNETGPLDDHSFSALKVKQSYKDCTGVHNLPITTIKVDVRKLDTLLNYLSIDAIDFLSIDVEGWELEVMRGFDVNKFKPSVILLENFASNPDYTPYMNSVGYKFHLGVDYNHIYIRQ